LDIGIGKDLQSFFDFFFTELIGKRMTANTDGNAQDINLEIINTGFIKVIDTIHHIAVTVSPCYMKEKVIMKAGTILHENSSTCT